MHTIRTDTEDDHEWLDRLDLLKRRLSRDTEVNLASQVGISPAMLGHVRAGRRPLPLNARIRLLDKLGIEITRDWLVRILPLEARRVFEEIDRRPSSERMKCLDLSRAYASADE